MFYDPETGICGPLCGKAECTHDNAECTAVFEWDIRAFAYHNGGLFFDLADREDSNSVPGRAIFCCDETGENRRKIGSVSGEALLKSTGNAQGLFHLGKVIYSGVYDEIKDGVLHCGVTIASYDLNNTVEETVLYEQEFTGENVRGDIRIQAVQEKLYFMVSSADYSEEGKQPEEYLLELYCTDIRGGEIERLYSGKVDFYASEFWVDGNEWLISSGSDGRVFLYDYQDESLSLWADFEEYGPYTHVCFSDKLAFSFHPDEMTSSVCIMNFEKEILLNDIHPREDYENLRMILCSDQESLYVKYFKLEDVSNETVVAIDIHSGERDILWADSSD